MKLFFSVGDASGDLHAANLIREIHRLVPDAHVRGLGGDRMIDAGFECDHHMARHSVMWLHALRRIPELRGILRDCARIFEDEPPDAVVLVDYVGFNLYVAREAKRAGVPVLYYISPQIWAHGSWRVKKLRRLVDKVLVIYPFEVEFYERAGVPVAYVGHPLFDELSRSQLDARVLARLQVEPNEKLVAIFPGSRRHEVDGLMPLFARACAEVRDRVGGVRFAVACARREHVGHVQAELESVGLEATIEVGHPSEVASAAKVCLTSSGTATLQIAYFEKPMVVAYRVHPVLFFLARPFIETPWISLPNVLAGEEIVPEFILTRPETASLVNALVKFLDDETTYAQCVDKLRTLRERVAQPGASERAAREIVEFVRSEQSWDG